MAITVLKRPEGHKIGLDVIVETPPVVVGDAILRLEDGVASYGITTGTYIFIDSNIESYNGFKYVELVNSTDFKISNDGGNSFIQFVRSEELRFYVSTLEHGYQCAHLPIVYELQSDIFPTNNSELEEYTPVTVSSFSEYGGNVRLNTSGSVDSDELLFIELVGDGDLAGVYQITNSFSGTDFVINLAYDSGYSFVGYVVVKYYNNYSITVNIYAGLVNSHPWNSNKPISLVASKRFTPDQNNKVKFSIDDIIRGFITTRNNLAIDTFPNNIDFLCDFYIGYYESWDVVEDGEIVSEDQSETIDDFIGHAINAKNEFKNTYSGFLSEYISDGVNLARWLTDFETPTAYVGYFFDMSFINTNPGDVEVNVEKYLNGYFIGSEILELGEVGIGVIRVSITPESGYDEYCIQASSSGSEDTGDMIIDALDLWTNLAGSDTDWTTGSSPTVTVPGTVGSPKSDLLISDYEFIEGVDYTITVNFDIDGPPGLFQFFIFILNSSNSTVHSDDTPTISNGNKNATITFTATGTEQRIGLRAGPKVNVVASLPTIVTVNSVSGQFSQSVEGELLTEEICIRILDECQGTFDGDARLTQDGGLRLLE